MTALGKFIRVSAVVAALGGALAVVPVQAQPTPGVDFNFRFGGPGFSIGIGDDRRPGRMCMSESQVRRDLRRSGYDDIRFTDRRGPIMNLRAEFRGRDYRISYDSCRGRIVDRDRIRGRR
jgi:hypothetical protein